MKIYKGAYSEYAISAFALFAKLEYPSLEEIRKLHVSKAEREDLKAAYYTFEILCNSGATETARAVKTIYRPCYENSDHIPRAVLRERLVLYAIDNAYSEESVYRMLARARYKFAEKRGLRVG